jgi:hypothetical protein
MWKCDDKGCIWWECDKGHIWKCDDKGHIEKYDYNGQLISEKNYKADWWCPYCSSCKNEILRQHIAENLRKEVVSYLMTGLENEGKQPLNQDEISDFFLDLDSDCCLDGYANDLIKWCNKENLDPSKIKNDRYRKILYDRGVYDCYSDYYSEHQ